MLWNTNNPVWLNWQTWVAYMSVAYTLFLVSKRYTDSGASIPLKRGNFGQEITLWQAVWGFVSHPTARYFVLLVAGMWTLRIGMAFTPEGRWSWLDLGLSLGVVLVWPLVEWVVHVFVLHAQPVKILGYTYDPLFAQIHRAHHRDPYHPTFGIVPPATLVQYGLLIPGVIALVIRWPRPVTIGAMVATMAFRYELWHYLIHSAYKPQSEWFRKLRDRHWWHHFQHEAYWYGITTVAADVLLGTNPLPHEVAKSPTARTLGHAVPGEIVAEQPAQTRPRSAA